MKLLRMLIHRSLPIHFEKGETFCVTTISYGNGFGKGFEKIGL